MNQRIVVIGGVAAGPKAAARARRLDPRAEITILERGEHASYGACGFPYHLAGEVEDLDELRQTANGAVRDEGFFRKVKEIALLTGADAIEIRRESREVVYRHRTSGETRLLPYDRLVLATGARAVTPPIPGVGLDNVFVLKEFTNAGLLRAAAEATEARAKGEPRAVIVGAGLIGLEVAEALLVRSWHVTAVEMASQVLPALDPEIAAHLEKYARGRGLAVLTGSRVEALVGTAEGTVSSVRLADREVPADLVLVAVGVRPEVELARASGLVLGPTGAIAVDEHLRTSDPAIYAAGDCAEKRHTVSGRPCWVPLGSTANREGRVAGTNAVLGPSETFPGVAGTLVMRFFDLTVARMGLGEAEARSLGFDVETAIAVGSDKPHFMEGAEAVLLKLIADRATRRLLGVQGVGTGDVARRVDATAAPLMTGMTVDQVANLDLLYAPPYSPPMDPLAVAANTLRNKLDGVARGLPPAEYRAWMSAERACCLVDVRSPEEHRTLPFPGGRPIPLGALRARAGEIPRDHPVVLLCKQGTRGYEGQRALEGLGFEGVTYLEGGVLGWPYGD
ncbi:MAG: FAD-dependent oxidoreductase [Deltaproteobacteria bacterium]|nr:FAD-dependent oxidoreductase [Deltaproteobacteria bacterium]